MDMRTEACEEGIRITAVTLDDGTGKISKDFIEYEAVFKKVKSDALPDHEEKMVVSCKAKNGKEVGDDGKQVWIPWIIFQEMQCRAHNFLFLKKDKPPFPREVKIPGRQRNLPL